jgi:hypothetical protein
MTADEHRAKLAPKRRARAADGHSNDESAAWERDLDEFTRAINKASGKASTGKGGTCTSSSKGEDVSASSGKGEGASASSGKGKGASRCSAEAQVDEMIASAWAVALARVAQEQAVTMAIEDELFGSD